MNDLLSKINRNDMNFVNKRFFKNNDIESNEIANLKADFMYHKIEIKDTINKIYKDYSDISNNFEYNKDEESYIYYFNMFIKKLIIKIKLNDRNNYIQNELSLYSNTINDVSTNIQNETSETNENHTDSSNNYINNLDRRTFVFKDNKNNTIHNFVQRDKHTHKILPKKINLNR